MTMKSPTAILAFTFFLSLSSPLLSSSEPSEISIPQQNCSTSGNTLECEIQEMKFKVAHLEFTIEKIEQQLYSKSLRIEKSENKIEDLSHTIRHLESDLSNLKDAPDYEDMIKVFEEQVRELEAVVKRNNLELLQLKVKAKDDEKVVKSLASQVERMKKIVPELWFHVQKLEQACEVIERRTVELRRHIRNQKCSFFKFINNFPGRHYLKKLVPFTTEAINQLRMSYSVAKKYHHQLQGFVKKEMEKNEYTAFLAGEELVFFMVSIVFVFPFILALKWLLSVFLLVSSVGVFLFMLALRLLSWIPFLAFSVVVFSLLVALR